MNANEIKVNGMYISNGNVCKVIAVFGGRVLVEDFVTLEEIDFLLPSKIERKATAKEVNAANEALRRANSLR